MLRITKVEDKGIIRLKIEGTVNADSCADIEANCSCSDGRLESLVLLDMSAVDFMTDAAVGRLARLPRDRVQFVNCSPFIEILLGTAET